MRWIKISGGIVGGLLMIAVAILVLQTVASERVEVVELHTVDESGEPVTTRLWIVDHDGSGYLRVGGDGSGWYSRLTDNREIGLTRAGERGRYVAVPRPELSDTVNDLMQQKYTWGDSVIAFLVGSRENSIPIQLKPVNPD